MSASVFAAANQAALIGWLLLAAAPLLPAWRERLWAAAGIGLPALLAAAYVVLVAGAWGRAEGGFGSIAEVRALFQNDAMLVAGWMHYLAFDLFVGLWIVREARRRAIPHLAVLPLLPLTLMFGPAGYLAFSLLRAAWRRPAAPGFTV